LNVLFSDNRCWLESVSVPLCYWLRSSKLRYSTYKLKWATTVTFSLFLFHRRLASTESGFVDKRSVKRPIWRL